VLVTGGSGFVGRWVGRLLRTADVDLHILDLAQPKQFEEKYTFHRTDLRDLAATEHMLAEVNPQVIIHLAGLPGVGASHDNPVNAYEANVLCTFNLLEACRRRNEKQSGAVQGICAVSSNHVYGEQHHSPTAEDAPLNGPGMYAVSKLCGDVIARTYGKTYKLRVAIARMTNSYGGDDHHVTHIITGTILSALRGEQPVIMQSGRDRKGYLYIKDTAEGLLAVAEGAATKPDVAGEAFNLCPNEAVTVVDLVRAVTRAAGQEIQPVIQNPSAEHEAEHLDNSKAKRQLGWSPRYSLADGLAESIAWYRQQPQH
jgi:CDP-glucose 4,6-dehydratase